LKDADSNPIDLTGANVRFHMKAIGGAIKVDAAMTIVDQNNGTVRYDWNTGDTDTVGTYEVEFEVTYSDGAIETFPNKGSLALNVTKELN
jgi:uncharacterized protein YfaS (alpha-2-macroglobulin family)